MSQDTNQEDTSQESTSAKPQQSEVEVEEKLQADAEADQSQPLEEQGDHQVEELQQKLSTLGEQLLREQAEMQNVRRRAQRDIESAHKYALEKFATELL